MPEIGQQSKCQLRVILDRGPLIPTSQTINGRSVRTRSSPH